MDAGAGALHRGPQSRHRPRRRNARICAACPATTGLAAADLASNFLNLALDGAR
jgi:hypothetical protein